MSFLDPSSPLFFETGSLTRLVSEFWVLLLIPQHKAGVMHGFFSMSSQDLNSGP